MDLETITAQPQSITDLQPKMRLHGTVKETQLYGAVVDIGLEYDGVVHISQLAEGRTARVTDVVKPGDSVTVWVLNVDAEKGRIGLTMVEPPDVNWQELAEGQVRMGTVTRLENYGAFVNIGAERPGLLHVREMGGGAYVRHPSELVKLGDEIEVRIAGLDRRKKRIDLTLATGEDEVPEETEEEPAKTAMEIALQRARSHPDQQERDSQRARHKKQQLDLSEREDILARTLREHTSQK